MDGLSGQELCDRLGIDAKQLQAWLREGLPSTGRGQRRRFDALAVRDWLLANDKAEPAPTEAPSGPPREQPWANTVAGVAEYFKVAERTIHTWIKQGMPGQRGRPGTQEAAWPLFDIEDWRQGRKPDRVTTDDDTKHQAQARLAKARAQMVELELSKALGQVVDAAEVTRRWLRFSHEARSQLAQLPTRIAKALPDELPAAVRKKVRALVRRELDVVTATLELFLRSEADEVDAPPPAEATDGKGSS